MKIFLKALGGRKAMAFYVALLSIMILAIMDKADTHTLGLIDTLYLTFAGANVIKGRQAEIKTDEKKETA